MKLLTRLLVLPLLAFSLTNCGDDDDDDNNDVSAEIEYQLFPDGYFSAGFREEYSMTGINTSGVEFEGTHFQLTQSTTSFEGQQVNPILSQSDWTDTNGGAFSVASLAYYSTDPNNRTLVGTEDILTKIVSTTSTTENIPITAQIRDSGQVGTFTDVFGSVTTQTWELQSADDGLANIVWASETRDVLGTLIVEGHTGYVINQDGVRQSLSLLFDIKIFADPVTWVGTKK